MREDAQSAFDAAKVIDHARATENKVQQLCRATLARPGMTPADVDIVVADLAAVAAALPEDARQLGDILAQANNDYALQMDMLTETADPDLAIGTARLHLDAAHEPALDRDRFDHAGEQTAADICEQVSLTPSDIEDLTGLPAGYLTSHSRVGLTGSDNVINLFPASQPEPARFDK